VTSPFMLKIFNGWGSTSSPSSLREKFCYPFSGVRGEATLKSKCLVFSVSWEFCPPLTCTFRLEKYEPWSPGICASYWSIISLTNKLFSLAGLFWSTFSSSETFCRKSKIRFLGIDVDFWPKKIRCLGSLAGPGLMKLLVYWDFCISIKRYSWSESAGGSALAMPELSRLSVGGVCRSLGINLSALKFRFFDTKTFWNL
jgi:hypothetical protein